MIGRDTGNDSDPLLTIWPVYLKRRCSKGLGSSCKRIGRGASVNALKHHEYGGLVPVVVFVTGIALVKPSTQCEWPT